MFSPVILEMNDNSEGKVYKKELIFFALSYTKYVYHLYRREKRNGLSSIAVIHRISYWDNRESISFQLSRSRIRYRRTNPGF